MVRSELEKCIFAGPVPDEGDNPTELEGKWRVNGIWIDAKLLIAGRKGEMEYMVKMGVFKVVDEKECYDNGCIPLILKWVDKNARREMPFEFGLSRDQKGQGQRRTTWARRILTHAAVGWNEDACVHIDKRT